MTLSPILSATGSLSISRHEEAIFSLESPKYEEVELAPSLSGSGSKDKDKNTDKEKDDWIIGDRDIRRNIMVVHHTQADSGVSGLDMRQSGASAGIGEWNVRIASDIVSIDIICIVRSLKHTVLNRRPSPR